jgi:hypothetical protein
MECFKRPTKALDLLLQDGPIGVDWRIRKDLFPRLRIDKRITITGAFAEQFAGHIQSKIYTDTAICILDKQCPLHSWIRRIITRAESLTSTTSVVHIDKSFKLR